MANADQRLNLENPLAHPTRQQRLCAAYRQRGYTRQGFADQLGVAYSTLRAWDNGIHTMPLEQFCRACALVGYSVEEITTGQRGGDRSGNGRAAEPSLTNDDQIRAAMDELGALPAVRTAFAEHMASPAGRFQSVTRSYIAGFVAAYGHSAAAARAINEQVDHALLSAGLEPISEGELNAFIRRLVAEQRRRQ